MATTRTKPKATRATAKKRAYHHGDLERALVDTTVAVIRDEGVDALTLRGVGARLGVSRTALYRHFDNKEALLARVAAEGFEQFYEALAAARALAATRDASPLPAMAAAYIRFALSNPSHYQTMFSGVLTNLERYPDLGRHAEAAFNILLDTIRTEQQGGRIGPGNPLDFAEITWSLTHGLATLGMAGQLERTPAQLQELARLGGTILEAGLRRA
jgi:AcrR family transcriptional regulator